VELGLPSITFADHAELASWRITPDRVPGLPGHVRPFASPDGVMRPPSLDVAAYVTCVRACRSRFPELRILAGVELSEPHRHHERAEAVIRSGDFDRVIGSVHTLEVHDNVVPVDHLFDSWGACQVVREYLGEVLRMIETSSQFEVLGHIDYPIRAWPNGEGRYDPAMFEDELREVLRALAATGRTLEVNTRIPLHSRVVGWWKEAGGRSISFGSDAHDPARVAHQFRKAAEMVAALGFRPGPDPWDFWC
jgi:histidinol-phosphatase (PHP family)